MLRCLMLGFDNLEFAEIKRRSMLTSFIGGMHFWEMGCTSGESADAWDSILTGIEPFTAHDDNQVGKTIWEQLLDVRRIKDYVTAHHVFDQKLLQEISEPFDLLVDAFNTTRDSKDREMREVLQDSSIGFAFMRFGFVYPDNNLIIAYDTVQKFIKYVLDKKVAEYVVLVSDRPSAVFGLHGMEAGYVAVKMHPIIKTQTVLDIMMRIYNIPYIHPSDRWKTIED